jgi:hypothetical protein
MDKADFEQIFERTKIVRKYDSILPILKPVTLPYVILIQHPKYDTKVSAVRGDLIIEPPVIYLPDDSVNFGDGFFDIKEVLDRFRYRRCGFQSYRVNHNGVEDQSVHAGKMDQIVEQEMRKLDSSQDRATGLMIGIAGHSSIAVFKYFVQVADDSRQPNLKDAIRLLLPPGSR